MGHPPLGRADHSLRDFVLSSMLGDGMVAKECKPQSLKRLIDLVRNIPAPPSTAQAGGDGRRGKGYLASTARVPRSQRRARRDHHPACGSAGPIASATTCGPRRRKAYTNYRKGYNWNFTGFRKVRGLSREHARRLWLTGPICTTARCRLSRVCSSSRTSVRQRSCAAAMSSTARTAASSSPDCDPNRPPRKGSATTRA